MKKHSLFIFGILILFPLSARAIPRPDHVVIVIEENHSYSEVINSPYYHSLVLQGASFTQSFALTHPSQPNYLQIFSGSNQAITDDNCAGRIFTTANLGAELISAGFTFGGYSEGLPSVGFTGGCLNSRVGKYAQWHNPWVNWQGNGTNGVPSASNMPFTSFPSAANFSSLPTVSFVIPNLDNDMHDGSVLQGDTWLSNNLDAYVQWAKTHNSLLILTADEDDHTMNNQIATIFVGPMVQQGSYSEHITHYNVLRTLEDMYGLTHAGNASTATPITDVWKTAGSSLSYTVQRADLWDNGYDNVATPRQSSFARFVFTTDAASFTVTGNTTIYNNYPDMAHLGIRVNGVNQSPRIFTSNTTQTFPVNLGAAGTTRTVEIIASGQSNPSAPTKSPIGTFINSVSYSSLNSFAVQAPTVGNRVLIYGDSISVGANAANPEYTGMPMLLRNTYGHRLAMEAWGYRALYDDANTTALRTALVNQLASYAPSIILMHIGANDYGLNRWSAATFQTAYAATLDALHAALPAAKIICLSSTIRASEGANSFGNTMAQYRTATANAAAGRSWAVYVDGLPMLTLSDIDTDGVHPTTAGHAKYAAAIEPYLTGSTPPQEPHPGDTEPTGGDYIFSLNEVTAYNACWRTVPNQSGTCPSPLNVDYAVRAGSLYKSTREGFYHYDPAIESTQGCPACWVSGRAP